MAKYRISMRTTLGLTVLIMGVLGMALAVATGEAFRQLALENQREAFISLAKLKFTELLDDARSDTIQMGLGIQQPVEFKNAFKDRASDDLTRQFNHHFERALVNSKQLNLHKIIALDLQFNKIAESSAGQFSRPTDSLVCRQMLDKMKQRRGAARLKPESELCQTGNESVLATIVPVGGLKILGYLMLVVNPALQLADAEVGLGTPMRILDTKGVEIYKSAAWPTEIGNNIMLASYILKNPSGTKFFGFSFATNIKNLQKQLSETRNLLFSIAAIVMLSTAILALLLFQRKALTPLFLLTDHLRRVQQDKSQLGNKLSIQGNTEIAELTTNFNNMSSELHSLYRTLENMAFTDELTGMANRALFYDRLEQAILIASRSDMQYAVLMMDLDRFKNINDTLGHHIGDRFLKIVSERIQSILRKSDTAARLGGDEFAVLLPAIEHDEGISLVAEKIVNCLKNPIIIESHSLTIGISIGMLRCPHDGNNATLLMQRADIAMYHAKRENINYAFYNPSMDKENLFELTMESELRKAIEDQVFELYYQPKINIKNKSVTGVEALIRWMHPEHGFISPDKFIPLAEQTGLIQPLTKWVLETALAQCAEWHAKNIKISISVNLSAYSLNDINLLDGVRQALAKAKLDPKWLILELTETAIMSDPDRALTTISRLYSMGIALSIDDFGTGYSSLANLKRFPVTELKIDKSFVIEMINDMSDAVIVRSTIDLAHNMGMTVVAEGIESQEVWEKLLDLGCDLGQGYLMCHPCPASDLEQWFQHSDWNEQNNTPIQLVN